MFSVHTKQKLLNTEASQSDKWHNIVVGIGS